MTIDEAIKHCEEVAEENEFDAKIFSMPGESNIREECIECASDHRQLAEWLKELEAYRDGCHCDTCKYSDKNIKNKPCGYCGDNESNWEYRGEVKADEDSD